MVDVTEKTVTERTVVAAGEIRVFTEAMTQIKNGTFKEGRCAGRGAGGQHSDRQAQLGG